MPSGVAMTLASTPSFVTIGEDGRRQVVASLPGLVTAR
jgi:hypothetical protein